MVLDRKSLKFHLKHSVFLVPSDLALRFQWNFNDCLSQTIVFVMKKQYFLIFHGFFFWGGELSSQPSLASQLQRQRNACAGGLLPIGTPLKGEAQVRNPS